MVNIFRSLASITLLVAIVATGGCGEYSGATSPEALLEQAALAADTRDAEAFIRSMDPSTVEGQMIASTIVKGMALSMAFQQMREALIQKFSQETVDKHPLQIASLIPDFEFRKRFEGATIQVQGNTATVVSSHFAERGASMIRKDGRWFLDPKSIFPRHQSDQTHMLSRYLDRTADTLIPIFSDTSLVDDSDTLEEFGNRMMRRILEAAPHLELLQYAPDAFSH
jgi:hypothetical protein